MNGVQVPEQHLNDTEVLPIYKLVKYEVGEEIELGLMQGFLTLPYGEENSGNYWISNYVDLDLIENKVRNYRGIKQIIGDPSMYPNVEGIGDQHNGLDYEGDEGLFVLTVAPGRVYALVQEAYPYDAKVVGVLHLNHSYASSLGHLNQWLVNKEATVYRGQIVGTNGSTGTSHPHIHFSFMLNKEPKNAYLDPYMDLITNDFSIIVSSNGMEVSIGSPGFWTKSNDPHTAD